MTEPADPIDGIPLHSLKRYLVATGWTRRSLSSGNVLFSTAPEGEDVEILLPESPHVRGLHELLEDAVATLSALERRNAVDVVAAVRAISFDLVRSRLPNAAIRHDTIRLGAAEEFIRRLTKLLAASAHAELHVGPYAQRLSSTATTYASECRFGHTFRGSFGFTIESPVGPNTLTLGEISPAPPLERRVVLRLARGLRIVESAIDHEDPSEIVKAYDRGLNANACEDLAAMVETPQIGEVRFDISFSPEWGVPEDVGVRSFAVIGQGRGLEVIREAAKGLRIVNYEKRRTIVGKVRTLHSMEDTPAELFTISGLQDIMVEWDSEEFGKRQVRVSLGPEEYLLAWEAHTTGRSVSVFGELERNPWRLENARDFKVL
jgi:hypothetical protein